MMPPILLHGRVVGRWRKKNANLTFTLFESVAEKYRKLILDAACTLWDDIRKTEWC